MKVIECVPNFSEGRDLAKISEIVNSVRYIEEVRILDLHSDPDHNRSVLTFISDEPRYLKEACYRMTKKALELIDIRAHTGVHPYIGVLDVIPFVPAYGSSPAECIGLAHDLGKAIWKDFKLPVYFYGLAALEDSRRNLADIRRGGFPKLKETIHDPERKPDIGDAAVHPSGGAVAIGARKFLIAFNINLNTKDLTVAKGIARSIREQHGGLPGVHAIGVPLASRGYVQVSINITDHEKTSIQTVFNAVTKEANKYEIPIHNSEIVGLIPQSAAFPNMAEYLKLETWSDEKILENLL